MEEVKTKEETIIQDKVYKLNSTRGIRLNGRIETTATLEQDRVELEIKPKKLNKMPVLMYEDILKVETGIRLSYYYCFFTILALIAMFASPFTIALAVLFAFMAVNHKVTISHRGGDQITVYSIKKETARDFANELRERVNAAGGVQI
ncbi:MAG: hypothetical protein ACI38A_11495 [Candidatus Ornithomonoglobus sp.]